MWHGIIAESSLLAITRLSRWQTTFLTCAGKLWPVLAVLDERLLPALLRQLLDACLP